MTAREKQWQKRESAFDRLRETLEVGVKAREDPGLVARFEAYASRVEQNYAAFDENHFSLSLLAIDEEAKKKDKLLRQEADRLYFEIVALQKEFKNEDQGRQREPEKGANSVRLPKITLPIFSGEFKIWPTFYELFESLIQKNEALSKIEKFHYLISSLGGEARNLLKGITLSESNYDDAYQGLVTRYQNKRRLAFYYWEELQGYQVKVGNVKDLRKFLDTFSENMGMLKNLGFSIKDWDFILFHLVLTKIDPVVRQKFEQDNHGTEIPSYTSLIEYLETYCTSLELSGLMVGVKPKQKGQRKEFQSTFVAQVQNKGENCVFCSELHKPTVCPQLTELDAHGRHQLVLKQNLCINCIRLGHRARECKVSGCVICKKKHHTLLHFPKPSSVGMSLNPVTSLSNIGIKSDQAVLLATVVIEVRDRFGNFQNVRALLDSGSQANFLSKACCYRLGLKPTRSRFSVCGLGSVPSVAMSSVGCRLRSKKNPDFHEEIDAFVLPQICQDLPVQPIITTGWAVIKDLELADPNFAQTQRIDMLLGADVFAHIFTGHRRVGRKGEPIALETVFGWCLLGSYQDKKGPVQLVLHTLVELSLDELVKRFWELDHVKNDTNNSLHYQEVEKYFKNTVEQDSAGRLSVALPFKQENPEFPNSRAIAIRRLISLERKLEKDSKLRADYNRFMKEYELLGHMTVTEERLEHPEVGYYMPHHPVIRPDSVSTKLRVVFDASTRASNGLSLNAVLESGPALQLRIVAVLLRFRMHRIGMMADIRQMYRQIRMRNEDRTYQKIVWRESKEDPIKVFQLNTVTYGVSAAPFLAIRSLQEVAKLGQEEFPLAAEVLKKDIYMDDTVTGAENVELAREVKQELISLLRRHGFELHKWASNIRELSEGEDSIHFKGNDIPFVKVLGLCWNTEMDKFTFSVNLWDSYCTKRSVLSHLARIFDPLGLISPVVFFVKSLFQRLWVLGTAWDEPIPEPIRKSWQEWLLELDSLPRIGVPRYVGGISPSLSRGRVQLHGFCDASERGFAAVIYVRCELEKVSCTLLTSKTKVAPIKQKSIPRLELCAAVLLAELLVYVKRECLPWLKECMSVAWTDSTAVLHWTRSPAFRFKPFVGHRVGIIQESLPPGTFRYIPTKDNPADIASRGTLPGGLINNALWWQGPSWLKEEPDKWPVEKVSPVLVEDIEAKSILCGLSISSITNLMDRVSSLPKLLRVLAYCNRFILQCKAKKSGMTMVGGPITVAESQEALNQLVKATQSEVFRRELVLLQTPRKLPKHLQSLNLFLDKQGVLRVGGRLGQSDLQYSMRYPMLLPRQHKLTEMIIRDTHRTYLHPGLQTLHFLLRQRFWILSSRRAIGAVIKRCVPCFRVNPKPTLPQMGYLPITRIQEAKAFLRVGVDFGGPFLVRPRKGRGIKLIPIYLCIFICHSTKAIHLEIVFGLTSEAFIAAWRRFVARRGACEYINCDNATNFVGASRIIRNLMKQAADSEGVSFQFNPPRAPHFGGLFEAGIKSVKTHLARVVGQQILTIEEFLTFSTQVEALLNSRPLWSMSNDPNDLQPLTPGHFLMIAPLTSLADPDLSNKPLHSLSRWQLVQSLQQSFWARWRREYLTTLQQRQKWKVGHPNVVEGALVILQDDQVKPRFWQMARVLKLHPGSDGVARVATVRTLKGEFRRPVVKLCPLPLVSSSAV